MATFDIQQLLGQAMQMAREQRLDEARTACQKLCDIDRENTSAWMLHGTINAQLGLYPEAAENFRLVTELAPKKPEAHLSLAKSLHAQGDLETAATSYKQALEINPELSEAWFNLGQLRGLQKRYADAEDCFRRLVALQPENALAHHNLAAALEGQERLQEAADSYRQAINLRPGLAEASNNLGVIQQKLGRLSDAETCYRHALSLNPDYAIAAYNLGTVLNEQGDFTEAQQQLHNAIGLRPDYSDAYTALGRTLQTLGRFSDAIVCYKQALKIDPHSSEAFIGLGNAFQTQGRFDEAYHAYQKAAAFAKSPVTAIANQAAILEKKNDIEQAYALIKPLLEQKVRDTSLVTTYAAISRNLRRHDEAAAIIDEVLSQPGLSSTQRAELHFSMGKLLDDAQDYEQAFEHFRQANDLMPYRYDSEDHKKRIGDTIQAFSAAALRQLPRASQATSRPIFIVGMPRSGTTLVEQILASHPQVHGGGELPYVGEIVGRLRAETGGQQPYPRCVAALTSDSVNRLSQEYLDRIDLLATDARHITDKMPHNFQHLGLIELLFPEARIIHCMRNPMDTCLSIFTQNFTANHGYAVNLAHLGLYYRQYQRLMAHWKSVLGIPILDLQYEQLTSRQDEMTRQLVDFCGIDWDDACLDFQSAKRNVATPSYEQVRKPMYRNSVDRWKNYEKHLEPLLKALGNHV